MLLCVLILPTCKQSTGENQTTSDPIVATNSQKMIIQNGDVAIDYQVYGQGEHTLLFVHGWCINQAYWDQQLNPLKSKYQIVTMDLPGFGKSGKNRENWTIEAYGEDVNTLINQLNLEKVILVGHSMGGDVVLEAALKNEKVIALIGVDNFKDVGVEVDEAAQAEIDGFLQAINENFSEVVTAYADQVLFHPSTDSLVRVQVKNDFARSDTISAIGSITALIDYASKEPIQLSNLKQKLYLINSDATPTYREGLDKTGVKYEVIDIQATGHYPMIEKPKVFNNLLEQVVESIVVSPTH